MALGLGCSHGQGQGKLPKEPTPAQAQEASEAAPEAETHKFSQDPATERVGITAESIRIGSCSALSGPAQLLGQQTVVGAKAYLHFVNDQGGVHGRQLVLNTYDDAYNPELTIGCFNKLVEENNFTGAFFVGTPTAAKYVLLARARQVPIVGLFTGAQLLHEPFRPQVVSIRASYYDETRYLVSKMVDQLKMTRIAVIYQDDAFGASVLQGVKRALKARGLEPVGLGSFQRNTLDVQRAIDVVKETSPEAVVVAGTYAPVAQLLKDAHSQSWAPLFCSISFVGTEALIKAAGKDAEGVVCTQVVPPPTLRELPTVALYNACLKKYFPDQSPNFVSLEGFVDAMVLVEGLKRAGKDPTRTGFLEALESIQDLEIGLGSELRLSYGKHDHKGFDSVCGTVIRNGEAVLLEKDWTKEKLSWSRS